MNTKILITLLVFLTTIHSVQADSCTSDTGVAVRYQLLGEDLELGDELTLSIGGYTINYLVNDFSKAADQWPRYLATEINAVIPASLAKAGDASNNYLPVASDTDNRLDILQGDIPVTFLRNGVDYSFSLQRLVVTSGINNGAADIPHLRLSPRTINHITIRNISNRDVSVNFNTDFWKFPSGQEQSTSPAPTLSNIFTSTNSPMNSNGAILPARTTGSIYYDFSSIDYTGEGIISWNSVDCGGAPLKANVELLYYENFSGGRGGLSVFYLNDGKPF